MKEKQAARVGGVRASVLFIPLVALVAALHILSAFLIAEVNRSDDALAGLMLRAGVYQQTATSLQAGSTTLSETATSYVLLPVTPDGAANVGPLGGYAAELARDRRGNQVTALFQSYDVSEEARAAIERAAEVSEEMMNVQLRAIALMRSVYPTPPAPALESIPDAALSEQELAMPAEERAEYARGLLTGQAYAQMKRDISQDIENCHRIVQEELSRASDETQARIAKLRFALWVAFIAVIGSMVGAFYLCLRWLVDPLRSYSLQIRSDQPMKQMSTVREMRLMVDAYNALLYRRNTLESILRASAETDGLTGLPNRTAFENAAADGTLAVAMFDVNFLKRVNDTQGHVAGDRLLRTAADCIRECFGQGECGNCYRIGGDEFAAVLRDVDEAEVAARMKRFDMALEREHISVSCGWALSDVADEAGFQRLVTEADQRMYAQKQRVHEACGAPSHRGA
jgi:diguanylate cyclase (GGDEF)-like protein